MKKYDFQDEAVDWLFEKTLDPASKKTIVLNAPTGSGKTVILINDLLRYFDAIHTVRVSATTVTSTDVEYKEVDEEAVIGEGLITEAISVNEGVVMNSAQDDAILLELADAKRKEIQKAYKDLGKRINPLVFL